MRDRDSESQPSPVPAGASGRSSSSQSCIPSRRMSKTPLFLPSPSSEGTSSEPPIRQRDRDRDRDPLDIIFIDSSSSSSRSRPPRRSPRKTKKQRGQVQLMTYVLMPPPARRAQVRLYAGYATVPHTPAPDSSRAGRGQYGPEGTRARAASCIREQLARGWQHVA
ncbi:hypothetical protein EDB84DRAFT_1483929 [Lactarius hengduanensis]|nr:hypothetical protein EDB84DRAFT_1483929 [Lactarius hengduanensis]